MWKKLPATIAAEGNQAEVLRFIRLGGEMLGVEPGNHYIHRVRASAQDSPAIARPLKLVLDFQGFSSVVVRKLKCGNWSLAHIFGWTRGVGVGIIALSLGERVDRDGAFISRRGPGEGSLARRAEIRCANSNK
jgi:hypothetical protein